MKGLLKLCITVGIAFCIMNAVTSTAGLSQFNAGREVAMAVANPKSALISMPDLITLDIQIQRLTTYYYKAPENPDEEKELVETVETLSLGQFDHNFVIQNNMNHVIRLESIQFDSPVIRSDNNGLPLGIGEDKKVDMTMDITDLTEVHHYAGTVTATLNVNWSSGQSIIYTDVFINVTETEEFVEEQIEDLNLVEEQGLDEGQGLDEAQTEITVE